MSLTARELQQIKGIGDVLAPRLLEAGHDSFAKIVQLGESGLKEIKGINQKAIPEIIEQAARLSKKMTGKRNEQVAALKGSLQCLRQSVQKLASTARERFSEKLAGKSGRKLTDSIVSFIEAVDKLENKTGKKLRRAGKAVKKTEQRLEELAVSCVKELRKELKRARKSLQRAHA